MSGPREDWLGSDLDHGIQFQVRRCYNGIMVVKGDNALTLYKDVLVFQDLTQFLDWVQHWFDKTKSGETP